MTDTIKRFIGSRILSFKFALEGLHTAFLTETNLRIHLIGLVLITGTGFWLRFSRIEWIFIVLSAAAVISAELINTAIEKLSNAVDSSYNAQIKVVKDVSAGAVLIFAIASVITGIIIITNHLPL